MGFVVRKISFLQTPSLSLVALLSIIFFFFIKNTDGAPSHSPESGEAYGGKRVSGAVADHPWWRRRRRKPILFD